MKILLKAEDIRTGEYDVPTLLMLLTEPGILHGEITMEGLIMDHKIIVIPSGGEWVAFPQSRYPFLADKDLKDTCFCCDLENGCRSANLLEAVLKAILFEYLYKKERDHFPKERCK